MRLTKEGDLSYFTQQASDNKQRGGKGGKAYGRPATRDKGGRRQPPKSAGSDKTVKQLLGELYGDRVFLEKLLKETGRLRCFNHVFDDNYLTVLLVWRFQI